MSELEILMCQNNLVDSNNSNKTLPRQNWIIQCPSELWILMIPLCSISSFSNTCKLFYNQQDHLLNNIIFFSTGLTSKEIHNFPTLKMIPIICSETKLHMLEKFRHKPKSFAHILYNLGVRNFSILDPDPEETIFCFRLHENNFMSCYFHFYPKITFYLPKKMYEVSYVPSAFDSHLSCIIDTFDMLCDHEKSKIFNFCIAYSLYNLHTNNISAIMELLNHHFPILPKIESKEFIPSLLRIMNIKCLVDFFFDIDEIDSCPSKNAKIYFLALCSVCTTSNYATNMYVTKKWTSDIQEEINKLSVKYEALLMA
jgi:hypothetical protein